MEEWIKKQVGGVCNKLGHHISIESKVNCGTKVIILMQRENVQQSDLTKM